MFWSDSFFKWLSDHRTQGNPQRVPCTCYISFLFVCLVTRFWYIREIASCTPEVGLFLQLPVSVAASERLCVASSGTSGSVAIWEVTDGLRCRLQPSQTDSFPHLGLCKHQRGGKIHNKSEDLMWKVFTCLLPRGGRRTDVARGKAKQ